MAWASFRSVATSKCWARKITRADCARNSKEPKHGKPKKQDSDDAEPAQGDGDAAEGIDIQAAEAALHDPQSYLAKSVPQRMAIISAGVIMNVFFAFLVATIAYGMGVDKIDSELGRIAPGGPAWRADLRVGDRVIEVAGKPIAQFGELQEATVFGSLDDGLPIVVRRPGVEAPVEVVAHPDRDLGAPTIGIASPSTTRLLDDEVRRMPPTDFDTPADEASPPFKPGDLVVAVNGTEVSEGYEYHRAAALAREKPMNVTIRRADADGKKEQETDDRGGTAPHAPIRYGHDCRTDPPSARSFPCREGRPEARRQDYRHRR